uniref:Phosphoprotein n=1 Tax=Knipowitschia caucasica TaxID=637954 RepID=A0AAV2M4C4_KNICA
MSGVSRRKDRRTKTDISGIPQQMESDCEISEEVASIPDSANTAGSAELAQSKLMLEGLARISNEIQDMGTKIRSELTGAKDELKQEITYLRQEMD